MKTIETERLILRDFREEDWVAVDRYASVTDNILYMPWGPNTAEQTQNFVKYAMERATAEPRTEFELAITRKEDGALIGAGGLTVKGTVGELGWILHKDDWGKGYGTEFGKALLTLGFKELSLQRIVAHCDAENVGSYRVMEKIGMRREGLFFDARPANKRTHRKTSDELSYGITQADWEIAKEVAFYNNCPVEFTDFPTLPLLDDGVIRLVCLNKSPVNPEKKWVPGYSFAICLGSEQVGEINLRIGYTEGLYYGGQIGYNVREEYRGCGYAGRACELVAEVARLHKMTHLLITNNETNLPSKRVCEKLGAALIRVARVPEWHDMYERGARWVNVFDWRIAK